MAPSCAWVSNRECGDDTTIIAPRSTRSISRIAAALYLRALVFSMDTRLRRFRSVARIARIDGAEGAKERSPSNTGHGSFSIWRHEKIGAGDTIATGSGARQTRLPGGTRLVLRSPATLGSRVSHPARRGRRE
jgi:hypothetical protein